TLVLAGASYHTIEMPFRQPPAATARAWRPRRLVLAGLVVVAGTTTASLVAASGYGVADDPVATRARLAEIAIEDGGYPAECGGFSLTRGLRPCVIGAPARRNVLFLGDSHAEPFYTHFEAGRPDHAFTFLTYGGCPPLPDTDKALPGSQCRDFLDAAWARAESGDYQQVVLSAFWPVYVEPYQRGGDNNHLLCFEDDGDCRIERDPAQYRHHLAAAFDRLAARNRALRARGIDVTLLSPVPFTDIDIPRESVRRAFLGIQPDALQPIAVEAIRAASAEARPYLERLAAASGAELIDPLASMCDGAGCRVSDDGMLPLYRDSNHLTGSAIRNGRLDFIDAAVLKR
ncbi:MAG: hypothetical protein J0H20_15075, partial [Rhizobiales bacterium]|nr:hypothetical protein [Hyphomicrobiales bacterium]